MPHLESRETQYNLRPHPLSVLMFDKIVNCTHSHSAFSKYVINNSIDR